jgi:uncharacterized protein YbjT (DUF2867 family)
MKYVITGSLGNISKPLTEKLVKAGHQVTVISSKPEKADAIRAIGAIPAIGSVEDEAFLEQTFKGADAVYTMVPPNLGASDWKGYIGSIGVLYANAIKSSGVKKVVNLSSLGAHMPEGCGPVSGLYYVEQALNQIDGIDVLHLRPGFFYLNYLGNVGMVKNMNIIGSNYGADVKMALVDTGDIAQVAFEALSKGDITGKTVRYIVSDERTTQEIASVLGAAVGKPELPWVEFKDEDSFGAMVGMGLSQEVAKNYVEMGQALQNGAMQSDFVKHSDIKLSPTKLENFAGLFAGVYQQN